jgi:hypothetical protein
VYLRGVPVDFILFGLTLIGVAVLHRYALYVALTGLAVIALYQLAFTGFKEGPGLGGLTLHMQHAGVVLTNLFLQLMGFANSLATSRRAAFRTRCQPFFPTIGKAALCSWRSFSSSPPSSTTLPRR